MTNMTLELIHHKQQGIALIQILLITAILTVFALYLTQTARQQIQMATWAQDKAEAEVAVHSAEAELIFTLLTEEKFTIKDAADMNSIKKKWNFHGQAFKLNSVVDIEIQDQAGLIGLHYLHLGHFRKLLTGNGVSSQRALQIGDQLYDWQDADSIPRAYGNEQQSEIRLFRNGKIPDITELEYIFEISDTEKDLIYNNTGIFYSGDVNPLTASYELISALSDQTTAQEVIALRTSGELTATIFKRITGINETNNMRFFPSNVLAIKFDAKVNQSVVYREKVISLSPYADKGKSPINILLDRS